MTGRLLLAALLLAAPAWADAPPVPMTRLFTQCATGRAACVTIDRKAGTETVTRGRGGAPLWRVRAAPPVATVSKTGRFVFEEHRPGGLVKLDDGPDTLLLVVRDRGRVTRELRLRDVTPTVASLPRTASHRSWAVVRAFDRADRLIIDLADGRRLIVNPTSGAIGVEAGDGRPAYCRYAEPDPHGPCARR